MHPLYFVCVLSSVAWKCSCMANGRPMLARAQMCTAALVLISSYASCFTHPPPLFSPAGRVFSLMSCFTVCLYPTPCIPSTPQRFAFAVYVPIPTPGYPWHVFGGGAVGHYVHCTGVDMMCAHTHTPMHACMYVCMYVCIGVHACMYVCVYVC
jgi:hypothetical protein